MSHVFTRSAEKPHLCHIMGFRFSFEKSERSENQKHFLINESYLHIISQLQHLYLGFKRNIIFVYSFNYNIQKWLLPLVKCLCLWICVFHIHRWLIKSTEPWLDFKLTPAPSKWVSSHTESISFTHTFFYSFSIFSISHMRCHGVTMVAVSEFTKGIKNQDWNYCQVVDD